MVWYENADVVIKGVDDNECIATNKTEREIYLIFNRNAPITENTIPPNGTLSITDKDLIRRIKAKEMRTFSLIIGNGGEDMKK